MLDLSHTLQGIVVKSISRNKTAVTNELMSDACGKCGNGSKRAAGLDSWCIIHRDRPDSGLVLFIFILLLYVSL